MVWDEIKRLVVVQSAAPGTFGYQKRLCVAADLMMAIRRDLKNEEDEIAAMNADPELREALLLRIQNREAIKEGNL